MNRRSFVKGLVGTAIVAGFGFNDASAEEVVEQKSLFGNSKEFLPEGVSDTVEVVLTSQPMEKFGHEWFALGMVIQNNTTDTVYVSDIEGFVRDADNTPLASVFTASVAPAVLQPGEFGLVDITLDAGIDEPDSAIIDLTPVWEKLEEADLQMYVNVSVDEAVLNSSDILIGTLNNDSETSYEYSVWNVVAICFDEDGNIVSSGGGMETATPSFIDGGTQTFEAYFANGEPTDKFLVGAVTSIWG